MIAEDLGHLLDALRTRYGYDFTGYAKSSLKRRIAHYMQTRRVPDYAVLEARLITNEEHFEEFIQELSVNVTEMFRDPEFFRSLRTHVVPRLATYPFIKVWIAGCATGEEVLSVAILLHEEGLLKRSRIYATDINQKALHAASKGMFPIDSMRLYTENYVRSGGTSEFSRYYHAHHNVVKFDEALMENIVFAPHNLAVDQSFNEFELILCRNVLIYFEQELQDRAIGLFHESLGNFGFMGLGSRESLMFRKNRPDFSDVDKANNIYMKIR
jgi:chemotaxis protein methyltransferase CheR